MTKFEKLAVFLLAIITPLLFIQNSWIPPLIAVFLIILVIYRNYFVLPFVIVSFLVLTSTINPTLRLVVQVLNILLLGYVFIKAQPSGNIRLKALPEELLYLLSGFFILMIVSTLFSEYRQTGLDQILRTLVFMIIMYLLYSQIQSVKDVKLLLFSLTAVAFFYSIYMIYELYENNFVFISVQQQLTFVYGGEYRNKNFLGGFLSVMIIFLLSYSFKPHVKKFWYFLLSFILFIGVILTNSRAALLALFIALIILISVYNKKLLLRFVIAAVILFLLVLVSPLADLLLIYIRLESVTTGRDYLVQSAIEVIKNHFLLGAGPAATRFEMYNHLIYFLGSPEEIFIRKNFYQNEMGQAHSYYLYLFSDLGIGGFVLSVLFPVVYFRLISKMIGYYSDKSSFEFYFIRALLVIGIFMFIRGLFEWGGIYTYGSINQDLPFWVILAALSYYYMKMNEERKAAVNLQE